MVTSTTDHTIELTPLDLLRYVEGERPAGTMRVHGDTFDGLLCVQFAYHVGNDYEHDAGMGNESMAPVLNTRGLKTIIGSGALRYQHVDTETRFFVVMKDSGQHPSEDPQKRIVRALKNAFRVHGRGAGDIAEDKDPRKVWEEYAEDNIVPETHEFL